MAIPAQVEAQVKQADKAWNESYGDPETDEAATEETADEKTKQDEPVEQPPTEKVDPEDYKQRFSRYKASADKTIHELRTQLASEAQSSKQLRARMSLLEQKLTEAPKADETPAWKEQLSQDDLEYLDEETLAVVAKVSGAAVANKLAAMQTQLDSLESDRRAEKDLRAEQAQHDIRADFVNRLRSAVPDVNEIDNDQRFAEWLNGVDQLSGVERRRLAEQAMHSFDVNRVASIYNEWKAVNGTQDHRESRVAPKRSADAAPVQTGQTYSRSDIKQFYADKSLGKYSDSEAKRIEQDIFAAQTQGRIT